jgi:TP901 family phage tail tape measure protein
MAQSYTRRINLYINGQVVRNDIKSITAAIRHLEARMKVMNISSKEYVRTMGQVKYLRGILSEHNAQLRTTSASLLSLKGIANAFNKFFPMIMGTIGAFAGLAMGIRRTVEEFAEFDDKVADVMKVTGRTRDEIIALNEDLKKLDTRSTQDTLLELAWVAGKLGLSATEDVMGFVNAADKITVALAKDLGGSAEEAVRQIGKMTEIFEIRDLYGIEDAMIRVGSAINELGMASTATESFLIQFASRVGGIAPTAGVSMQSILGLAATLDILGQRAEVSGTAYSRVMTTMAKDTEVMARIAGMGVREFAILFEEDANEAMLQVFEAMNRSEGGFTAMIGYLSDAGLEGQRLTQVLGVLARNTHIIRRQQEIANRAFADGDSVIKEFNIKNQTAQAIIEKKQKDLKNLRIEMGERLMPVYMGFLNTSEEFLKIITRVIEFVFKYRTAIIALVASLIAYNTVTAIRHRYLKASFVLNGYQRASVILLSAAYNYLTGNVVRATAAMRLFRMAQLATPWGLILGGISAVIAALATYAIRKRNANKIEKEHIKIGQDASDEYNKQAAAIISLRKVIEDETMLQERRIDAVKELRKIMPGYNVQITKEGKIIGHNAKQIDVYLDKLRQSIYLKATQDRRTELIKQQYDIIEQVKEHRKEIERLREVANDFDINQTMINVRNLAIEDLKSQYRDIQKMIESLNEAWRSPQISTVEKLESHLESLQETLKRVKESGEEGVRINIAWEDLPPDLSSELPEYFGLPENQIISPSDVADIENMERLVVSLQNLIKRLREGPDDDGKPIVDFSPEMELYEQNLLKAQYLRGEFLGGEAEFQQALSDLQYKFMKGRFDQMDLDSTKWDEARGELLDKQIEREHEALARREALLDAATTNEVDIERKAYSDRLKELGLYGINLESMDDLQKSAYLVALRDHQNKIADIEEEASRKREEEALHRLLLNEDLVGGQQEYERKMAEIELKYLEMRKDRYGESHEKYDQIAGEFYAASIKDFLDYKKRLDQLLDAATTDEVEIEQKAFDDKLKALGLYGKDVDKMTTLERAAYEALLKAHNKKVAEIHADRIKDEVQQQQDAHDNRLHDMQWEHSQILESLTTLEDYKEQLREFMSDRELKDIRTVAQAREALIEQFQQKELGKTKKFLNDVLAELKKVLQKKKDEALITGEDILSEGEVQALIELIRKLEKEIMELRKKTKGEDEDEPEAGEAARLRGVHMDIFGFRQEDWENFFDNIELAIEGALELEDAMKLVQMAVMAIGYAWSDMNKIRANQEKQALQEFEDSTKEKMEILDEQLNKGYISQEAYNHKIKELEAELDRKKAEYARDQAIREKRVATMTTIVNTAAAIVKAFATLGPIAGPIMAAIIAAAGAAQLAIIRTTPLPQIPGAETGGYLDVVRAQDGKPFKAAHDPDKRGWVRKPTVITGENGSEYVIPREGVENPHIRPIIESIEMARINGNLPSLNLDSLKAFTMPGRQAGGSIAQKGTSTTQSEDIMDEIRKERRGMSMLENILENTKTLKKIQRALEEPIRAEVALTGRRGLHEAEEQYKQLKKNVYL